MDERESYCTKLLSSETTAKGTGLARSAAKEDPIYFGSSRILFNGSSLTGYLSNCLQPISGYACVLVEVTQQSMLNIAKSQNRYPPTDKSSRDRHCRI